MEDNIKKIVELEIDLDNLELEEMGVQVVSFVEEPAIEVDFMAFAAEQFVKPIGDEDHNPFMSRCIGVLVGEEGYEADQAAAICHTYWEEKHGPTEMNTDYFDLDEACWAGYEPIGMKDKNGRQVPNCVPIQNSKEEFASYNDYPESAKSAAKRALEWRDSHPEQSCGTRVGWARANQLAKGEMISEETIARMASFARHLQYKDVPYSEGCGGLMVDAWGGQAGIEWAQSKLDRIREESDADVSQLEPYVDYGDEIKKKDFSKEEEYTKEQEIILAWAQEHGEQITEDFTYIDPSQEEFNTIENISKAITGLDILGKMGIRKDEPAQIRYRYTGPRGGDSRSFCRAMLSLNKVYAEGDMRGLRGRLSAINPDMGPGGRDSYNVFAYKGGVNCRHWWSQVALYKPEGSRRVLMIEEGPAQGDAGKSNNSNTPSPAGSVSNNASLRFSFAIQDEDKRIVAGPLMTPNKMILRRDGSGEPYYVFFSKDTIRRIQERFNRAGFQNVTDIDHDGQIKTDNILLEQWLVESRVHDKSRFYGFNDLPIGSWFGVYKVNNDETWEDIKAGKIKGFSIAGDFINKAQPIETDETVLDKIINVLKDIN